MVPILTLSGCKGNINCIDTHPLDIKKFISWLIYKIKNDKYLNIIQFLKL